MVYPSIWRPSPSHPTTASQWKGSSPKLACPPIVSRYSKVRKSDATHSSVPCMLNQQPARAPRVKTIQVCLENTDRWKSRLRGSRRHERHFRGRFKLSLANMPRFALRDFWYLSQRCSNVEANSEALVRHDGDAICDTHLQRVER